MNPDNESNAADLIDVVIQSCQKMVDVQTEDGKFVNELQLDSTSLWWKTGSVNSNTFARFAFELQELYRMALLAKVNMCAERANQFIMEIMELVASFRYSVDAKSSESIHTQDNSRSTLIDKINRNKIEKVYTSKTDKAKGSIADIFLGKDKEKDMDDD